jgi:hypothetical protein
LNLDSIGACGRDEEDRTVRELCVDAVLQRRERDPDAHGLAAAIVPVELELGRLGAGDETAGRPPRRLASKAWRRFHAG